MSGTEAHQPPLVIDVALLKKRVTDLESLPPRVIELESQMNTVKNEVYLARKDIARLGVEVHASTEATRTVDNRVQKLFWTGAGVFIACSSMISLAAVIISAFKNGVIG